jgi:hypothetical protein
MAARKRIKLVAISPKPRGNALAESAAPAGFQPEPEKFVPFTPDYPVETPKMVAKRAARLERTIKRAIGILNAALA